jgi:hypothetical protein
VLNRVLVLMSTPVSLLLAGLLQLLLCFGICKTETEFDPINIVRNVVEVFDDLLGNVAILESGEVSRTGAANNDDLPSEAHLLANSCIGLTTNLGRDGMVWLEVIREILKNNEQGNQQQRDRQYSFVPLDRNACAVDVGRCAVFKILQAGVPRFLQSSQTYCAHRNIVQHTCA